LPKYRPPAEDPHPLNKAPIKRAVKAIPDLRYPYFNIKMRKFAPE
jgi:hypothetical protein